MKKPGYGANACYFVLNHFTHKNVLYIIHRPALPTLLSSKEAPQFQTELGRTEKGKMFSHKSVAIYIAILLYAPIGAPMLLRYQKMPGIMILWPNVKVLYVLNRIIFSWTIEIIFQGLRDSTSSATHQGGTTKEHVELEQV